MTGAISLFGSNGTLYEFDPEPELIKTAIEQSAAPPNRPLSLVVIHFGETIMPKYMVIETSKPNCLETAYRRFYKKGRMMPEGLSYIDSWLEKDGDRCFQLMETDNPSLFKEWIANWEDLTDFEVVEIGLKPEPEQVGLGN